MPTMNNVAFAITIYLMRNTGSGAQHTHSVKKHGPMRHQRSHDRDYMNRHYTNRWRPLSLCPIPAAPPG